MIRLVRTSGKSIPQLARELDLGETGVRSWVRQAEIDEKRAPHGPLTTGERADNVRLRRSSDPRPTRQEPRAVPAVEPAARASCAWQPGLGERAEAVALLAGQDFERLEQHFVRLLADQASDLAALTVDEEERRYAEHAECGGLGASLGRGDVDSLDAYAMTRTVPLGCRDDGSHALAHGAAGSHEFDQGGLALARGVQAGSSLRWLRGRVDAAGDRRCKT